ncbi:hypothetical protein AGMMS49965_07820 [Bacteroidia bacterium]|nr:hypothetical protein AGMMS49965_07820 [Bacteroidia bacterium]
MEQKITCLQDLLDWINNSDVCTVTETGDDYFIVEAPNNADVYVHYEADDEIDDIVKKTMESLYDFDADERFEELWEPGFVSQNHFRPSQFIKMLQKDEETFRGLAGELRELDTEY